MQGRELPTYEPQHAAPQPLGHIDVERFYVPDSSGSQTAPIGEPVDEAKPEQPLVADDEAYIIKKRIMVRGQEIEASDLRFPGRKGDPYADIAQNPARQEIVAHELIYNPFQDPKVEYETVSGGLDRGLANAATVKKLLPPDLRALVDAAEKSYVALYGESTTAAMTSHLGGIAVSPDAQPTLPAPRVTSVDHSAPIINGYERRPYSRRHAGEQTQW